MDRRPPEGSADGPHGVARLAGRPRQGLDEVGPRQAAPGRVSAFLD